MSSIKLKIEQLFLLMLVSTFLVLTGCGSSSSGNNSIPEGVGPDNELLKAAALANPGYKIAFGDETSIFMMNPDGSDIVELANGSPVAAYVAWGPGAKHVYFASAKGPGESAWEAFRVNVNTLELQQLSNFDQDVRSLGVSPNGLYLAVSIMTGNSNIGNNNDDLTQFNTDLYIVEMATAEALWAQGDQLGKSDMRILISSPPADQFWYEELNWNPVMPVGGGEPVLAYTKTWRYDEDDVSYTRAYTIRADGTDQTEIVKNNDQPVWDFTGQRLSFLGFDYYDFSDNKIKQLNVSGMPDDLGTPAFSPDGEFILFEVGDENRQVGMAYADAREDGVIMGKIIAYEPRWSPVPVP